MKKLTQSRGTGLALAAVGVLMMAFGIYRGEMMVVLTKAVNICMEYIVHNGMMKDLSVLLESPFTDRGSISEIFTDMGVWLGIKKVIDTINENAAA